MEARRVRRLIVNADDFGFTPAVTAGILEAHAAGSVTSTSVMVHCPGWDDAVTKARAATTLGFGLHFNLVVGAPLANAPTLTDPETGRFIPYATLARRALLGRLDPRDVSAECEAQLKALSDAGIRTTHIDSHKHTHAMPVIHRAVAAIAARLRLPLRRPVESHLRAGDARSQLHRGVIAMSWRATGVLAARTRSADHFAGVSMQGNANFAGRFLAALEALQSGTTELMVHPGRVDAVLEATDTYTWEREREVEALTSAIVRERLGRSDMTLINFSAL